MTFSPVAGASASGPTVTDAPHPGRDMLTDADYRSLAEFRATLRRYLAVSERIARSYGVTPSQHQLLLAVRGLAVRLGGPPSIGHLADSLQLRPHSAGELIDRAIAKRLLERHTDPDDLRRSLVSLTSLGLAKLDEISQSHRDELRLFRSEVLRQLSDLEDESPPTGLPADPDE